jgi:hypothetical protein
MAGPARATSVRGVRNGPFVHRKVRLFSRWNGRIVHALGARREKWAIYSKKPVRNGPIVQRSYTTVRRTPAPVRLYVRSRFSKKRTVVHRSPRGKASHVAFGASKWLLGLEEDAGMTPRQRLPDRRGHELLDFEHAGIQYTAGVGRFDDGRLAEVFLNTAKHGTAVDVNARDAAVAASLLFQYGCPLNTLRRALTRNADGSASGPLARALDLLASKDQSGGRGG